MLKFKEILDDLISDCHGKSLRDLGMEIGISESNLSRYLDGSIPTPKNAIKLANYFRCSLDYLFGIENNFRIIDEKREIKLKEFYPKYEKLLKTNNITHGKLSTLIDICETSLSAWKKGGMPSMHALIEIAYYFGESIDYLICK